MLNSELGKYSNSTLSLYTNEFLEKYSISDVFYVTDRTSQDVERWKELQAKGWEAMTESERQEWLGAIATNPAATKGMYSYKDLNRVELAVRMLSVRLRMLGYDHEELITKTDWTYKDSIWREDIERYYRNIAVLRNLMPLRPDIPSMPSVDRKLDYAMANDIEKILQAIDDISVGVHESKVFVGELIVGEV